MRLLVAMSLFALLTGCRAELLTGLNERQANEVIALLLRNNIDVQKEDSGKGLFRVEVDREAFADAVSLLEKHQLPSREDVAIADLFPADTFVNSPITERARLISGLEQRLEQTARAIDHVLSARVHISYPMSDKPDSNKQLHVSMMLNCDGSLSDALLIQKLKQLVRNSFEALSYEDISVVIFYETDDAIVPGASESVTWAGWRWVAVASAVMFPLIAGCGLFWRRSRRAVTHAPENEARSTP